MSDETARLHLPQLVTLQELNNITWNEALEQLDGLVDLFLLDQYIAAPPSSPQDGDAYLIGGTPAGAFSGYAYKIASWRDGAWRFYQPFNGLRAFVAASETVIVYWSGNWTAVGSTDFATKSGVETFTNKTISGASNTLSAIPNAALTNSQVTLNGHGLPLGGSLSLAASDVAALPSAGGTLTGGLQVPQLGIGTAADAANPLAFYGPNALFHSGGDIRVKLNKTSAGNTASFLFQDGFSGRGEIGLCGDDSFRFKVSANGSDWNDAIVIAAATGVVALNSGLSVAGASYFPSGIWTSDGKIGCGTTSPLAALHLIAGTGAGGSSVAYFDFYGATPSGGPNIITRSACGSVSAPSALQANYYLGGFACRGYGATGFSAGGRVQLVGVAAENWSDTAQGAYLALKTTSIGTTTLLERVRITDAGWLGINTSQPFDTVDVAGNIVPHADNTYNLGSASLRLANIYAANGTINTSGAATKTGVRGLSAAEIAAAEALATDVRVFQFVDAVAKKGGEAARWHIGMIFEAVVAAFAAQGLDPMRYGIVCRDPAMKAVKTVTTVLRPKMAGEDASEPVLDAAGQPLLEEIAETAERLEPDCDETGAPKFVLALRYDELAQFLIAGLAARLSVLEQQKGAS